MQLSGFVYFSGFRQRSRAFEKSTGSQIYPLRVMRKRNGSSRYYIYYRTGHPVSQSGSVQPSEEDSPHGFGVGDEWAVSVLQVRAESVRRISDGADMCIEFFECE